MYCYRSLVFECCYKTLSHLINMPIWWCWRAYKCCVNFFGPPCIGLHTKKH